MNKIKRMIAVAVLMMSAVAAFAQDTGGYRILDGRVYYNNTIMHEADPNTIMDLGYGYAKDNENVWYEGKLLPLVDARSFRLKNSAPQPGPAAPAPAPAPMQNPYAGSNYGIDDLLLGIIGVVSGQNPGQAPGQVPGHNHVAPGHNTAQNPPMQLEVGYEIIGNKVYYNGVAVSNASAHSFKDLGWGYAKDSSRVYYCGKKLTNDPSRFKALTDGYAMDSFDVYYFGKKIEASTSGFKVLKDGYAKDAFDAYYCGKKVVGSSGSTFQVLNDGYAKDAWETYYLGKKVK